MSRNRLLTSDGEGNIAAAIYMLPDRYEMHAVFC
jgi:hypothetical protein